MRTAPTEDIERVRALAGSLDCLLEDDLTLLVGIVQGTTESWPKRGEGPAYAIVGRRVLYSRAAVAAYLASRTRERRPPRPKGEM